MQLTAMLLEVFGIERFQLRGERHILIRGMIYGQNTVSLVDHRYILQKR